jgi:uncharacterized membrane protein
MIVRKPDGNIIPSADARPDNLSAAIGASSGRTPFHRGLVGAGAVLLMAAFVTDLAYYGSALWQWANYSAWLITAGLVVMLVAGIFLLVDFATGRARRLDTGSSILVAAAVLLSLVNAFVHSRDGWTSVVPQGIGLSGAVALLLLIAGARGWSLTKSQAFEHFP